MNPPAPTPAQTVQAPARPSCFPVLRLDPNNADIWTTARERLDNLPPCPTISASGSWGTAAFVRFILGPGRCSVCSEWCYTMPVCFALGIRICSSAEDMRDQGPQVRKQNPSPSSILSDNTCRKNVTLKLRHWTATAASFSYSFDEIGVHPYIPVKYRSCPKFHFPSSVQSTKQEMQQAESVDAGTFVVPKDKKPPFVVRTVLQLDTEWIRRMNSWRELVANHHALHEWTARYKTAAVYAYAAGSDHRLIACDVRETNKDRLKTFASRHGFILRLFFQTYTVKALLAAFNRDKTLIDKQSVASRINLIRAELEYAEVYHAITSVYVRRGGSLMVKIPDVGCPSCPETFLSGDWRGFKDHAQMEHGDGELTLRCPNGCGRAFSFEGLVEHIGARIEILMEDLAGLLVSDIKKKTYLPAPALPVDFSTWVEETGWWSLETKMKNHYAVQGASRLANSTEWMVRRITVKTLNLLFIDTHSTRRSLRLTLSTPLDPSTIYLFINMCPLLFISVTLGAAPQSCDDDNLDNDDNETRSMNLNFAADLPAIPLSTSMPNSRTRKILANTQQIFPARLKRPGSSCFPIFLGSTKRDPSFFLPKHMTDKKHCYCKPTCGELLSARGRRRHYQLGNPLERRQSVSPTRSESDDDAMRVDPNSPVFKAAELLPNSSHRRTPSPTCEEVDEDVEDEDEHEDDDKSMSDAEESDVSDLELDEDDEWDDFDEEQDRVDVVSREEMIRELEEMLGPDEEAELWDIRAYKH
ncbi:hypothetical protein C8R46DRAFT_1025000 [Mycena filopes]|nr:hypothetical protein C8R46DRAFT_1025000 [Mycena filopes]